MDVLKKRFRIDAFAFVTPMIWRDRITLIFSNRELTIVDWIGEVGLLLERVDESYEFKSIIASSALGCILCSIFDFTWGVVENLYGGMTRSIVAVKDLNKINVVFPDEAFLTYNYQMISQPGFFENLVMDQLILIYDRASCSPAGGHPILDVVYGYSEAKMSEYSIQLLDEWYCRYHGDIGWLIKEIGVLGLDAVYCSDRAVEILSKISSGPPGQ